MHPASPAIAALWADFSPQEAALHALPLVERVAQANTLLEAHVKGLATLCIGGGEATAMAIELV